ncbi:ZBED5 protein, partial [Atractosteus spatula]|nr:ZBED5 protein [Atractosteus spatula]
MSPAHLRRHFTTKHALLKDKPVDFFQRKLKDLKQRKSAIRNSATPISKAQEGSYYASLRIAKAGKPRTIGEELCSPLAKELILIVCGEKAAKQLDLVAPSKDAVTRRITDMVDYIKSTLIERVKMSRCFSLQLDESVDVVNLANLLVYVRYDCIKARPMNSRLFGVLCNEMEVRRLSRGRVLTRLFELHSEVQMFLHDQQSPLASLFDDPVWLVKLAYLADTFTRLNELNMGLQGLSLTFFDVSDKITAMKKKLQLFVNKINAGDVSAFPTLENHLHTYGVGLDAAVRDVIAVHLLSLKEQLWIRNPFTVDDEGIPKNLSCAEQEKLLELSSDATLMSELKRQSLLHFWIQRQSEYPALSLKAVQFLMPFATTYLCEKGFSALTAIKTKYRNKMDAEPDLRLKLTALVPDIARL